MIKLNLIMDLALSMQKKVNGSWQISEILILKEYTDEKCKLKSNLKMLFRKQADLQLMAKRRSKYDHLLQKMDKRTSFMKWVKEI